MRKRNGEIEEVEKKGRTWLQRVKRGKKRKRREKRVKRIAMSKDVKNYIRRYRMIAFSKAKKIDNFCYQVETEGRWTFLRPRQNIFQYGPT